MTGKIFFSTYNATGEERLPPVVACERLKAELIKIYLENIRECESYGLTIEASAYREMIDMLQRMEIV